MILQYVRFAWHTIRKHRSYAVLNIFGFSFALAVVILIGLYAYRELSMNTFHKDSDRIYKISGWACPYALAGVIQNGVPEIEAITNVSSLGVYMINLKREDGKEIYITDGCLKVNNAFFQIFSFPIVSGDRLTPLSGNNSLVLTRTVAKTLFDDTNPIGQTVEVFGTPRVVTAVTDDVPFNSSIRFSIILPLDPKDKGPGGVPLAQDWKSGGYEIFAKVRPGQDIQALNAKIQDVVKRNGNLQYEVERVVCYPLSDVYFNYADLYTRFKGGNYGQVRSMIWVGIIILLLAIINFFNLSTAIGMMRSKEIGLKKVNGATQGLLIGQFVGESVLITFIAMLLALLAVNLMIPFFCNFIGSPYAFSLILMNHWWQWALLLGGSIVVGTIAGSYPAFYLSRIDPINALYAGRVRTGFGVLFFRKVLIVFQLVASIIIIACTLIISCQINHLRTKDLGFDKEQILCIGMDETIYNHKQAFLSEIAALPFVQSISITRDMIGNADRGDKLRAEYHGEERDIWAKFLSVDTAFFSTFGVELINKEARLENGSVLINEQAKDALGADDIESLRLQSRIGNDEGLTMVKTSGVCKNFNFKMLTQGIEPLAIYIMDIPVGIINVRIDPSSVRDINRVVDELARVYRTFQPKTPFNTMLLDSYLAELYSAEKKFRTIFTAFSVLAVLISCFGLFGLIVFSNARRRKEVGVRKVQGATTAQVVILLIGSFLGYVGLAFVIAAPAAAWLMHRWLQGYPYRTPMHLWVFLLAGFIVFVVVVLTVGLQSWRTAMANPVKSLRSE